jgi:hypothetical protein
MRIIHFIQIYGIDDPLDDLVGLAKAWASFFRNPGAFEVGKPIKANNLSSKIK